MKPHVAASSLSSASGTSGALVVPAASVEPATPVTCDAPAAALAPALAPAWLLPLPMDGGVSSGSPPPPGLPCVAEHANSPAVSTARNA